MNYEATLYLPRKELEEINAYLQASRPDEYQGRDAMITHSVLFPNGHVMDIKCCGCEDSSSWTEAVLFAPDENGGLHEVCCTEPEYEYDGDWELEDLGEKYEVHVLKGKDGEPEKQLSLKKTLFWHEEDPYDTLANTFLDSINLAIYLHGICGVFALALCHRLHYDIYVVAEENIEGTSWESRLIHIYCKDPNGNFVDVRGLIGGTLADEKFFEEFEDFFVGEPDIFQLRPCDLYAFLENNMGHEELDKYLSVANKIVSIGLDAYKEG